MITRIKNRISYLKSIQGSNGGFSLVELLVATIILGTVTLTVCMMMSSGTNMYVGVNKLSSLMYKSQVSTTQLKEYFVDCDGIAYDESADIYYVADIKDDGSVELNSFHYSPDDKVLYLQEFENRSGRIMPKSDAYQPFATKVSSFDIDVKWFHPSAEEGETSPEGEGAVPPEEEDDESKASIASSVDIKFTFEMKGSSYDKSQFVSLKNVPVYLENTEGIYWEDFPEEFVKAVRGE